jgi:hypothetical protein
MPITIITTEGSIREKPTFDFFIFFVFELILKVMFAEL